jgi:hypothetical protein
MTFEDPPPVQTGKYDWPSIAQKVKAQPMQYLKVFDDDRHSFTVSVRQGSVTSLHPDKGFEVSTRNNHVEDGRRMCAMYLRYNPSKDRSK